MANEPTTQPSELTTKGFSLDAMLTVVTDNIAVWKPYQQQAVNIVEFVLGKDWTNLSPEERLAEAELNRIAAVQAIVAQHPEWLPDNLPNSAKLRAEQETVFLTSLPSDAVAIKQTPSNVPNEEPVNEMNEISVDDAGNKPEALRAGILNLLATRTTQLEQTPKAEEKPVVEASELPYYQDTGAYNNRTPDEVFIAMEKALKPITLDAGKDPTSTINATYPISKYSVLQGAPTQAPIEALGYTPGSFNFFPGLAAGIHRRRVNVPNPKAAPAKDKEQVPSLDEQVIFGGTKENPVPNAAPESTQSALQPNTGVTADLTDEQKHYLAIIAHYKANHPHKDATGNLLGSPAKPDDDMAGHSFYLPIKDGKLNDILITPTHVTVNITPSTTADEKKEVLKQAIIAAARLHHGDVNIEKASPEMRVQIQSVTAELAAAGAFTGIDGQPLRGRDGNVLTAIKMHGVEYKLPEPQTAPAADAAQTAATPDVAVTPVSPTPTVATQQSATPSQQAPQAQPTHQPNKPPLFSLRKPAEPAGLTAPAPLVASTAKPATPNKEGVLGRITRGIGLGR